MDTEQKDPPKLPVTDNLTGVNPPAVPRKKHTTILVISIALLLVAGLGIWLLTHKTLDKPSQQQSSTQPAVALDSVYLQVQHDGGTVDLRSLNTATKAVKALSSAKTHLKPSYATLPNGTIRQFIFSDVQDADKGTTGTLSFKDTEDGKTSKTIWPGPMNASGTKGYFYETDNIANTSRALSVNQSGQVEEVISNDTYKAYANSAGGQGVLIPLAVSKDEKTLYIQRFTCLNCDGPAHGDVITYNTADKTFKTLFAESSAAGGASNVYGEWTKLSDNYLAIFVSNRSSLGSFNYEQDVAGKDWLYLFDVQTGKAAKVFETSGDNATAKALQLSSDGKTFYYYTQQIIQGAANPNDTPVDHSFEYATNEVRAYTIKNAQNQTIDFGLDGKKTSPVFLSSNQDKYILGTSVRQTISSAGPDDPAITAPKTVYTAAKATPKVLKQVYQTEQERYINLGWAGFIK
jgi:hypothetical protein